jgi:hypothetical protein
VLGRSEMRLYQTDQITLKKKIFFNLLKEGKEILIVFFLCFKVFYYPAMPDAEIDIETFIWLGAFYFFVLASAIISEATIFKYK